MTLWRTYRMNEWMMNEWMNEWMDGWMDGWMNEWMNDRVGAWVGGQMREWLSEWMNEWMNEWKNKRIDARMDEWMSSIVLPDYYFFTCTFIWSDSFIFTTSFSISSPNTVFSSTNNRPRYATPSPWNIKSVGKFNFSIRYFYIPCTLYYTCTEAVSVVTKTIAYQNKWLTGDAR